MNEQNFILLQLFNIMDIFRQIVTTDLKGFSHINNKIQIATFDDQIH